MIRPVILAGGQGFRLWPLSRETCPKQYISLMHNGLSLIQHTVQRLQAIQGLATPIIICNQAHQGLCREQMQAMGLEEAHYIIEPFGRNTAPAVAGVARYCEQVLKSNESLLILPADHVINNDTGFAHAISEAGPLVERGRIVIFGITPTEPHTGYGYIHAGEQYYIQSFTEKPEREQAKAWIEKGGYYWNSGIFFAQSQVLMQEIKKCAPEIDSTVANTFEHSVIKDDVLYLDGASFAQCPNISFDYAVMEKTESASMVKMPVDWSDLGSWESIAKMRGTDKQGNTLFGPVIAKDTQHCFIQSDDKWIVTYGVSDLVIISSHESVLIMEKSKAESIKNIIDEIKEIEQKSPALHAEIIRPWGTYESVLTGKDFQVKKLTVNPGAKISLQMHHHRSETWVVVSGIAKVTLGETTIELNVNETVHIDAGEKHRAENIGDVPLIIVETQVGTYLGEDDIVRLQDDYGRA